MSAKKERKERKRKTGPEIAAEADVAPSPFCYVGQVSYTGQGHKRRKKEKTIRT
jgi:hypothetical protein